MNFHSEIELYLFNNQYQELVVFLEDQIEVEPDNIFYYCYLGLAYLLLGDEEQSQAAWFWVFSQEEKTYLEELSQILETEAKRQFDNQNYQLSYNLRQIIREINRDSVNNLLLITELAIKLKIINNQYLQELNLIEALKKSKKEEIEAELLYRVLSEILEFPFVINVDLTEVILENREGNKDFINLTLGKAHYMGNIQNFPNYSFDLATLCLKYFPNHLGILKDIFWYCISAKYFEKAEIFAEKFLENAINIEEKIYGYYLLIYIKMTMGKWANTSSLVETNKTLLLDFLNNDSSLKQEYVRDALIFMRQCLLYCEDNPKEIRKIINQFSSIYQKSLEKQYLSLKIDHNRGDYIAHEKLKIGYIASTLRSHSVGILSRWLIRYLDRDKFDIYIYLFGSKEDEITENWFKKDVKKFVNLPKDALQIVQEIHQDKIDILVDLDCLTNDVTQNVMALKPAPLQISWLGLDATGIPAVDYYIVDPYVLPDTAQDYYQEKIWRLPNTYLAIDGFEVGVPNILRQDLDISADAVVYLNIQNALKRHPDIIHLQMKIIKSVPNSYFFIKGNGDQEVLKELFMSIAQEEGISQDRLRFLPQTLTVEIHRANLSIADVVLDTYPYNGATTTLETLWQEVPLVTRVGEQFAARNSYGFMVNAGITEGIAWSDEAYIEWGIKLGTDEGLRKQVSWKLKQSKKTSHLWKAKEFTQEMEKAYQKMWKIYINT